jgi:hypothetical protein
MSWLESEIRRRIDDAAVSGRPIEGVLFHATCEEIDGPLHGGGADRTLWTARCPFIAQQYIPASGMQLIFQKPSSWEMEARVRPDEGNVLYMLAKQMTGSDCHSVRRDDYGMAASFGCDPSWPRIGEVVEYLDEELGYVADNGLYRLKSEFRGDIEIVRPSAWSMPGSLWMTIDDGLRFRDIRQSGEPDLTVREHLAFGAFEDAAANGWDGVIINDFCQTDEWGNVGHLSYGLAPEPAAAAEWISIPAARCDIGRLFDGERVTDELAAWMECGATPVYA